MDFKTGDIIEYTPFGGGTRRVEVTEMHADIKNGRAGFDGILVDSNRDEVWGYTDQVTRVVVRR